MFFNKFTSLLAADLIAALEKAGLKFGSLGKPTVDKLKADTTRVDKSARAKNGPKTKQGLEEAAKDVKKAEFLLGAIGPKGAKLEPVAKKADKKLEQLAKQFTGPKGPFAKLKAFAKDTTKEVNANSSK